MNGEQQKPTLESLDSDIKMNKAILLAILDVQVHLLAKSEDISTKDASERIHKIVKNHLDSLSGS